MSDYTPTTEDVRLAYIFLGQHPEDEWMWDTIAKVRGEEFDRWLVAHDAELLECAAHRAALEAARAVTR